MVGLTETFGRGGRRGDSDFLRQKRLSQKARQTQKRREDASDKLNDELLALATDAVIATDIQIAEFKDRLDEYETATTAALMENQVALDAVRVEIQDMLDRAYVMEDGRRVFKSEDGSYVIDEFGEHVSPDELDYDLVPSNGPNADVFKSKLDIEKSLMDQRKDLFEYQDKLDAARDRIEDGEIPKDELDVMDADLLDNMPPSVAAQISGFEAATMPKLKESFVGPASQPIVQKPASTAPQHDPMG